MSLVTHNPLSPDAMMQISEQNLSVSCLNRLPLAFADYYQIRDSGSGISVNSQKILTSGSTHSPLSPLLPDAMMQVSEQNISVSYLNRLPLAIADSHDSGFWLGHLRKSPEHTHHWRHP
jgi:hypothetical protein